jgi:DNA-binding cell septation regulator SpoVG
MLTTTSTGTKAAAQAGDRDCHEEHAMDDMTIFNLHVVNKGALKATVSIRLGNGLTIHDCKIIQQDGTLSAALPQRAERQKGGEVVYHDLVEFADPETWPAIAPQLVAYYQAAHEEARGGGDLV